VSRYVAAEVISELLKNDCTYEGDAFVAGSGWISRSGQVFMLPRPDLENDIHWFDADVIDDILANRWLGFSVTNLKRHE
jgi:hypothetical protein